MVKRINFYYSGVFIGVTAIHILLLTLITLFAHQIKVPKPEKPLILEMVEILPASQGLEGASMASEQKQTMVKNNNVPTKSKLQQDKPIKSKNTVEAKPNNISHKTVTATQTNSDTAKMMATNSSAHTATEKKSGSDNTSTLHTQDNPNSSTTAGNQNAGNASSGGDIIGPTHIGGHRGSREAEFPEDAINAGMRHGSTRIKVLVGANGKAKSITIVKSTHQYFTIAARKAVKSWRYNPATRGGVPIDYLFEFSIIFNLKD